MIEVYKYDPEAKLPTRNNPTDAGLDLYALEQIFIPVGHTVTLRTGIAIHVTPGMVGKIEDRSSLASKGLRTGGGIIDAGYSGEVKVVMHNLNFQLDTNIINSDLSHGKWINKGEKIAQLLMYRVDTSGVFCTTTLWTSDRGVNGWGSSGVY